MSVKTTGKEWKAFYADPAFWPADRWHDDVVVIVNGRNSEVEDFDLEEDVPDDAKVSIVAGVVLESSGEEVCALDTYFKRWRKAQTHMTFVVTCPREKEVAVREAIKAAGGAA